MKIIYLAAFKALHSNYPIVYQDINGKRDLSGCMLEIDLSCYDILIATPPCNYYSRANYRRDSSIYSQNTKDLLPKIIDKFISTGKPFIVENVRNYKLFKKLGLFDKNCFVYFIGRHTYWTNCFIPTNIFQDYDFINYNNKKYNNIDKAGCYRIKNNSQGGDNVYRVIETFLEIVYNGD